MHLVKSILAVVWPTVYIQLQKLAEKTTTPFDDMAIHAFDTAINYWLTLEDEEDEI